MVWRETCRWAKVLLDVDDEECKLGGLGCHGGCLQTISQSDKDIELGDQRYVLLP